ncbi:MAG: Coenzyme F420 hydrogenase/dehydrogenase, beta subunit C-terminal domain [Muribaculaceae bacterium]
MDEDSEGFLYPKVDASLCIDCKLCEKVCPVINQNETRKPIAVYAAKNPNEEIRMKSSSGGIFSMLAESTINQGGVVFGARFNEKWEVIHDYTETVEGIIPFRGSKYVQSQIGDSYIKAQNFLKEGREVLFSGTPCQIAGLNKFLSKEYDNLLTVDVVCHGVPSPLVWRDYLDHLYKTGKISAQSRKDTLPIGSISFRDKRTGWKNFSFVIKDKGGKITVQETLHKNIFMQGFLNNLYLRPSCYACPSKAGKSQSDITIADFWGIQNYYPEFDDDKGTGLILINTQKASQTLSDLSIESIKTSYNQALPGNPTIEHSVTIPKLRDLFCKQYSKLGIVAINQICQNMRPKLHQRVISVSKLLIKKLIRKK